MTHLAVGSIKQPTVPTNKKHTHNKYFSHNKHTLFALTKMCLSEEEEDFGKNHELCRKNHELCDSS